jgi:hypothetical protein
LKKGYCPKKTPAKIHKVLIYPIFLDFFCKLAVYSKILKLKLVFLARVTVNLQSHNIYTMKIFLKYIHLLLLSCLLNPLEAQVSNFPQLSSGAVFSLITCTPGDELYNQFGHSAIRLVDADIGFDFVYNFGTFNFETPNFGAKFVQRKLMYTLSKSQYKPFVNVYIHENRGVAEQKLILDANQKQKLFEFLETNYLPQNREYLYDFFYDNCATRIRDAFSNGLGKLSIPDSKSDKRFRDFLDEYLGHDPWLNFGIYLILGLEADKKCDYNNQMFLPDYLSSNLGNSNLNGSPLMEKAVWLLPKPEVKKTQLFFSPVVAMLFVLGISILLILLRNALIIGIWECLLYIMLSLAGFFLLFMWFGTDHIATQKNLNVLWANPLYLPWIFMAFRKKLSKITIYLGYILLAFNALSLIMFIVPIQKFSIALLPLIVAMSLLLLHRIFLRNNNYVK